MIFSDFVFVMLLLPKKRFGLQENLTVPADTHLADSHFLIYTRLGFDLQGQLLEVFGGPSHLQKHLLPSRSLTAKAPEKMVGLEKLDTFLLGGVVTFSA